MSEDEEVTIAGRVFRLGMVYAPVPGVRFPSERRRLPLRLVSYDPTYPWPDGRVEAEYVPSAVNPRAPRRRMSGRAWVAWAGVGRLGGRDGRGRAEGHGAVTDRARMAALPGETPVDALPLPRRTIAALRAGDVLTLGQLRGMRDRELLALRLFGRGGLAHVRSLVPAPGGGVGQGRVSTDARPAGITA